MRARFEGGERDGMSTDMGPVGDWMIDMVVTSEGRYLQEKYRRSVLEVTGGERVSVYVLESSTDVTDETLRRREQFRDETMRRVLEGLDDQ